MCITSELLDVCCEEKSWCIIRMLHHTLSIRKDIYLLTNRSNVFKRTVKCPTILTILDTMCTLHTSNFMRTKYDVEPCSQPPTKKWVRWKHTAPYILHKNDSQNGLTLRHKLYTQEAFICLMLSDKYASWLCRVNLMWKPINMEFRTQCNIFFTHPWLHILPAFPGSELNKLLNMMVQPPHTQLGKHVTAMGTVHMSDMIKLIRWVINISSRSLNLEWFSWTQNTKYCKWDKGNRENWLHLRHTVGRQYSTSIYWLLFLSQNVFLSCEETCMVMIMLERTMPEV